MDHKGTPSIRNIFISRDIKKKKLINVSSRENLGDDVQIPHYIAIDPDPLLSVERAHVIRDGGSDWRSLYHGK